MEHCLGDSSVEAAGAEVDGLTPVLRQARAEDQDTLAGLYSGQLPGDPAGPAAGATAPWNGALETDDSEQAACASSKAPYFGKACINKESAYLPRQ